MHLVACRMRALDLQEAVVVVAVAVVAMMALVVAAEGVCLPHWCLLEWALPHPGVTGDGAPVVTSTQGPHLPL